MDAVNAMRGARRDARRDAKQEYARGMEIRTAIASWVLRSTVGCVRRAAKMNQTQK